jgi:hypothetical protein
VTAGQQFSTLLDEQTVVETILISKARGFLGRSLFVETMNSGILA